MYLNKNKLHYNIKKPANLDLQHCKGAIRKIKLGELCSSRIVNTYVFYTANIRMEIMLKRLFALIPVGLMVLFSGQAMAGVEMRSKPWQMWLQEPMSESAELVHDLNLYLMLLETAIVLFVLALMWYILVRFNEKK